MAWCGVQETPINHPRVCFCFRFSSATKYVDCRAHRKALLCPTGNDRLVTRDVECNRQEPPVGRFYGSHGHNVHSRIQFYRLNSNLFFPGDSLELSSCALSALCRYKTFLEFCLNCAGFLISVWLGSVTWVDISIQSVSCRVGGWETPWQTRC